MNKRESVVSDGGFNIVDAHDYLLTAKPIMSMGALCELLNLMGLRVTESVYDGISPDLRQYFNKEEV